MARPKLRTTDSKLHRVNGLSRAAIEAARKTSKMLPHELLLCWANGIEIAGLRPDPAQQLYAAVAAAPYYQPKLANIEVKQDVRVKAVISAAPMTQHQWAQKYLNQQATTVATPPLPDVVPTVAYEVAPSEQSLVTQNNNSGEVTGDQSTIVSTESVAIEANPAITLDPAPPASEALAPNTANPANQNENPENADPPAQILEKKSETWDS